MQELLLWSAAYRTCLGSRLWYLGSPSDSDAHCTRAYTRKHRLVRCGQQR
nr:MAG TPA: hypothetical protein [Caudoviricetes sp.]